MFEGSTEFLSYALVMFLAWIYLPYTFFRFCAERFIDLGRRRDSTQLEEIIAAFLPSIVLNIQAILLFKGCNIFEPLKFKVDFAVMASIFGQNRGAVSDYIYAGNWWGCVLYIGFLWTLAIVHGLWFGNAARKVCRHEMSVNGVDEAIREHEPGRLPPALEVLEPQERLAWRVWYPFFHESIVPLFAWNASRPYVRVETIRGAHYYGTFLGYEKTTDGRADAIRMRDVKFYDKDTKPEEYFKSGTVPMLRFKTLFLNWSEISNISISNQKEVDAFVDKLHEDGHYYHVPSGTDQRISVRIPRPEAAPLLKKNS